MTPEQFAYWLQGFLELHGENTVSIPQVKCIKDHLAQVFVKKTPDRSAEISDYLMRPYERIC